MKEQDVQKKIINYLESLGAWTVKTISTNKRGTPDVLACLNGRFIAIEVKAKGKMSTVTPIQKYQLDLIDKSGGIAIAADSLEKTKEILDIVQNKV
jgi:Holliday junction resolvase